jgi:lipoteichoic acid synthase
MAIKMVGLRLITALMPTLAFIFSLVVLYNALVYFYGLDEWVSTVSLIDSVSHFSSYYAEVGLIFILFMLPGFLALRLITLVILIFVYSIQVNALWLSNDYLSVLALENIEAIDMIVSENSVFIAFLISTSITVAFIGISLFVAYFSKKKTYIMNAAAIALICIATAGAGFFSLEDKSVEPSNPKHKMSPMLAALSVARNFLGPDTVLDKQIVEGAPISTVFDFNNYGLNLDINRAFPMMNSKLYQDSAPFKQRTGQSPNSDLNVIVFFVEALSSRKLSLYGAPYSDLTPHLDSFASDSLQVDNYFNHTQSTFRGIRGQLCSMFPYHTTRPNEWRDPNFVPPQTRYACLPHILADIGYETIFLGPDDENHMHFRHQTESIGFTTNYYQSQILDSFLASKKKYGGFLTDVQLAEALPNILDQRKSEQPFFIAGYFKSSHVGQDSKADGIKYQDGKNRVLNTLHTFDAAFGKFWEYFKTSPYAKNTIVIVTADHAHWPEREYIKIAGKDFNRTPIDKIALFINSPAHNFPKVFNATNLTSIAFAPTVSQLLNLSHRQNHFLGYSIFDNRKLTESVAWFNRDLYVIDREGELSHYKVDGELPEPVNKLWNGLRRSHHAELNDQMLPFADEG